MYRKKDRPSIFITHHAIFDVENCLFGIPYVQGKKFERINQRNERRRSEANGDK